MFNRQAQSALVVAERDRIDRMAAGFNAMTLVGTAEQIVERMQRMTDAGLAGLAISFDDYDEGLAAYDEAIRPLLIDAGLRVCEDPPMKLVSYGPSGAEQPGVLVEEGSAIVPLAPLWRELGSAAPGHDRRRRSAAVAARGHRRRRRPLARANRPRERPPGPPVPRPSKIVVCGLNTHSQWREAQPFYASAAPRRPPLALRPPSNVAGPHDVIACPPVAAQVDYEAELAVVIGRAARRVTRAEAEHHIAGYMCAQDLTSADAGPQRHRHQPAVRSADPGKGVDSFCPTGPWLASADEIADPAALSIRAWVNDELRQDSSTADLIVGVPELVEWLSATFALLPGDIILTGTPAGMGGALDPPQLLRHGDIVRTAISGLGEMVNRVEEIGAGPPS